MLFTAKVRCTNIWGDRETHGQERHVWHDSGMLVDRKDPRNKKRVLRKRKRYIPKESTAGKPRKERKA